jgi:hypothetical protein
MEDNLEEFNKKIVEAFGKHKQISNEVLNNFSQLLWTNPEKALNEFFDYYDKSLDKVYTNKEGEKNRCFVEATCGGPHEAIPSAFYNSIGAIYPVLKREIKNKSLEKILNIFGGLRYDYVQISHSSYIREPALLSDIAISCNLYWPGMDEGENLIKKYNNLFCDFKFEAIDEKGNFNPNIIQSDFIVAYSLLRKDFCNWGEEYVKIANPNFLDRTLNGIAGMRFATLFKLKSLSKDEIIKINHETREDDFYSKNKNKLNKVLDNKISEGRERLRTLLPKSVHNLLEEKIIQKEWAEPLSFQAHKSYLFKCLIERYVKE